jgi:hypothetical protein
MLLFFHFIIKEEQLKGRPGYEHLSEPLHILIEAELPANVIDARLAKAQEILEELLKPVVCICVLNLLISHSTFQSAAYHKRMLKHPNMTKKELCFTDVCPNCSILPSTFVLSRPLSNNPLD